MFRILICGPEESAWTEEQKPKAKARIHEILKKHIPYDAYFMYSRTLENIILVSGHCPVDFIPKTAIEVANELGIKICYGGIPDITYHIIPIREGGIKVTTS